MSDAFGRLIGNKSGEKILSDVRVATSDLTDQIDKINSADIATSDVKDINATISKIQQSYEKIKGAIEQYQNNNMSLSDLTEASQRISLGQQSVANALNSYSSDINQFMSDYSGKLDEFGSAIQQIGQIQSDNQQAVADKITQLRELLNNDSEAIGQITTSLNSIQEGITSQADSVGNALDGIGVWVQGTENFFDTAAKEIQNQKISSDKIFSIINDVANQTQNVAPVQEIKQTCKMLEDSLTKGDKGEQFNNLMQNLTSTGDSLEREIEQYISNIRSRNRSGNISVAEATGDVAGLKGFMGVLDTISTTFENVLNKTDDTLSDVAKQAITEQFNKIKATTQQIQTQLDDASSTLLQATQEELNSIHQGHLSHNQNDKSNKFQELEGLISNNHLENIRSNDVSADLLTGYIRRDSESGGIAGKVTNFLQNGNILGNDTTMIQDIQKMQRSSLVFTQTLNDIKRSGGINDESKATMLTDSLIQKATDQHSVVNNLNLTKGGGKNLSEDDKKLLNTHAKGLESTREEIKQVIAALLAYQNATGTDMSGKIKQLEAVLKTTDDATKKIESVKDSSGAVGGFMSNLGTAASSMLGLFKSGMSLMGLGGFTSLSGLMGEFSKGINMNKEEGEIKYNMARSLYSMGAGMNQGLIDKYATTYGDELEGMSYGKINRKEASDFFMKLQSEVGGHYGGSQSEAAQDMDAIVSNTLVYAKAHNIDTSTVAGVMKTFYKDLGMSADESSKMLMSMGNAAKKANVPMNKYISDVTNLANSLRDKGLDARNVVAGVSALQDFGVKRYEDAMGVMSAFGNAASNMGNNLDESGIFGLMTGQAGDVFEAINQGTVDKYNGDGSVNRNWAKSMMERIMAKATMFGDPESGGHVDTSMFFQMMKKYTGEDRTASMLTDAARQGKSADFLAAMFADNIEETEGGQADLGKEIADSTKAIKSMTNQLDPFTKQQATIALAERQMARAVMNKLAEPMENFRKGFMKVLETLAKGIETFATGLAAILKKANLGSFFTDEKGNLDPWSIGGVFAVGTGAILGGKAIGNGLAAMGKKGVNKVTGSKAFSHKNIKANSSDFTSSLIGSVAMGGIALGTGVLGKLTDLFKLLTGQGGVNASFQPVESVGETLNKKTDEFNKQVSELHETVNGVTQSVNNSDANNTQNTQPKVEDVTPINANSLIKDAFNDYSVSSAVETEISKNLHEVHGRYGITEDEQNEMRTAGISEEKIAEKLNQKSKDEMALLADKKYQNDGLLTKLVEYAPNMMLGGGTLALGASAVSKIIGNRMGWGRLEALSGMGENSFLHNALKNAGDPTKLSTTSAFTNSMKVAAKDMLSLKTLGGKLGVAGAVIGGVSSIYDTYQQTKDRDDLTTGDKAVRYIGGLMGTAGGILGGMAGTFIGGPVGTFLGGVAGQKAGEWLGDKLVENFGGMSEEEKLAKRIAEGDEEAKKIAEQRALEKEEIINKQDTYKTFITDATEDVQEYSKEQIDQAKESARLADNMLRDHGRTINELTDDQKRHMTEMMRDLKAQGLDDLRATYLATGATLNAEKRALEDAKKEVDTDAVATTNDLQKAAEKLTKSAGYNDQVVGYFAQHASYGWKWKYKDKFNVTDENYSNMAYQFYTRMQSTEKSAENDAVHDIAEFLNKVGGANFNKYKSLMSNGDMVEAGKVLSELFSRDIDGLGRLGAKYELSDQNKNLENLLKNKNENATAAYITVVNTEKNANQHQSVDNLDYLQTIKGEKEGKKEWESKSKESLEEAKKKKRDNTSPPPTQTQNGSTPGKTYSRQALVNAYKEFIDKKTKYESGGASLTGSDCSGTVMASFNKAGYNEIARKADDQLQQYKDKGATFTDSSKLQAGDLIFNGDGGHVAMYAGNGVVYNQNTLTGKLNYAHEEKLEDYLKKENLIFGDTGKFGFTNDIAGADASAGAGASSADNENYDPSKASNLKEAMDIAGKGVDHQIKNWLGDPKLKQAAMKNKIATGQLVYGPSTLDGAGYGDVNEAFHRSSGMRDVDKWGYGIYGMQSYKDGAMSLTVGSGLRDLYKSTHSKQLIGSGFVMGDKTIYNEKASTNPFYDANDPFKAIPERYTNKNTIKASDFEEAIKNAKNNDDKKTDAAANAMKDGAESLSSSASEVEKELKEKIEKAKEEAENKHDVKIDVIVQAKLDETTVNNMIGISTSTDKEFISIKNKLQELEQNITKAHQRIRDNNA